MGDKCAICQRTQRANTKEPALMKKVPEYPFQVVASDVFNFAGDEYLLIADHYSGFFVQWTQLALLLLRNTEKNEALKSQLQRLFGRTTRSILPTDRKSLHAKIIKRIGTYKSGAKTVF